MPPRVTANPIVAPQESALWPKTLAETGVPTRHKKQRRGRVGAAILGLVAALVLIVTASLVASATGLVALPGPRTQASPSEQTVIPTATATLAPTATAVDTTPTANLQQIADQRAYNSFRTVTLSPGSDASCSAANASTTFASSQQIYVNMCTSAHVSASTVTVVVKQTDKSVCTLNSLQANTSYSCHWQYSLAAGRYSILVTMKVNGTQATARELPFTITN